MVRVAFVVALIAACKRGADAPPSPLQDGATKVAVVDAPLAVADAAVAKARPGAAKVGVGVHHACALLIDGTVRCWGKNDHGQLGDGTQHDSIAAVAPNVRGVKDLVVGDDHACALIDDTSVVCWGKIGFGGAHDTLAPAAVPGVRGVIRIFVVGGAGCATEKDGALVCWGDVDPRGHVTTTAARHAPTPVPGVDHVVALVARAALREDGDLSLWLDDGAPARAGGSNLVELAARGELACALDDGGHVSCYAPGAAPCAVPKPAPKPAANAKPKSKSKKPGKAGRGKPAKPEPKSDPEPKAESHDAKPLGFALPLPVAKHLAFGSGACVITVAKQLICSDVEHRCVPVRPWPAMNTVDAMSGACAKLVNGTARCGVAGSPAAPVIAGVAGALQVSATLSHGCAILADHRVACWEGTGAAVAIAW